MPEAVFDRDGDAFVATSLARGPWDPAHCHGGAPAALLAALVDAAPAPVPMQGVRITYDLAAPVPLGVRLTAHVDVLREGRRIQVLDAHLADPAGTPLVRARALRVRTAVLELPDDAGTDEPPPRPGPDALERFQPGDDWSPVGFWTAVDVRFVAGALGQPGRGVAWFRLTVPIAPDVATTPLTRAGATADFGNGVGPPLPLGPYLYINPDLTVDLHRLPSGPWVGLAATSVAEPSGVGLTTSLLYDEHGRIGTALQSLFIDVRDG